MKNKLLSKVLHLASLVVKQRVIIETKDAEILALKERVRSLESCLHFESVA